MSSAVLKALGVKKCLIIGAISHLFFILANILPAWRDEYFDENNANDLSLFFSKNTVIITILVISVILNGLGASILWVSQGDYFT